jgi:hypothetical protein
MSKVRLATFSREISTSIFPDVGLRTPETQDVHIKMTIRQFFTLQMQDENDSESEDGGKNDDDGENEIDSAHRCYINALHFPLPGDGLVDIPRAR